MDAFLDSLPHCLSWGFQTLDSTWTNVMQSCYIFRDSLIKILLFLYYFIPVCFFNIMEVNNLANVPYLCFTSNQNNQRDISMTPVLPLTYFMTLDHYLISLSLTFVICKMRISIFQCCKE